MSSRPTTHELKQSFMAVANAIEDLTVAKEKLIHLITLTDEVENSTFLVENHHRWAAPDADTHDVLYARLEQAKAKLSEGLKDLHKLQLQISEAQETLQYAKAPITA
jgi:hypothetical protein